MELKLEQKPVEDLASGFTSFELTLDGALATLIRNHNEEQVKVQLDANSAIEAGGDDEGFDVEEGEEEAGMDEESEVETVNPAYLLSLVRFHSYTDVTLVWCGGSATPDYMWHIRFHLSVNNAKFVLEEI